MKVSILSAVKNESAHIQEMIASVQRQTHKDWELLFVDDGSIDNTVQLIQSAAGEDSRIRLIEGARNPGKVAAFNAAFDASSGDLVVLLAGDDRLPETSLADRCAVVESPVIPAIGKFKLRTFSADPRHDAKVIPRGKRVSDSGGVIVLTRPLASQIFPVPSQLPSEDTWIGYLGTSLAVKVYRDPKVVLEYRIHDGNSNPRLLPFDQMSSRMAARHAAWHIMLESRPDLGPREQRELRFLVELERMRLEGRPLSMLFKGRAPLAVRLSLIGMSTPCLFAVRSRFHKFFSGWIGK